MNVKIASAVAEGTAHRTAQPPVPCQDAVASFRTGVCACIALADGAGSRPGSHLAAQSVTRVLAQWTAEHFDECWDMADDALAAEIVRRARADQSYPADCTLLLTALHRDGRSLLFHEGDGMAFAAAEGGAPRAVSLPENGGELNVTWFFSSPDAPQHLRIRRNILPDGRGSVLLCSDGAAESLFNRDTSGIAPAVGKLAEWLRMRREEDVSAKMQLELDELFRTRTHDDMSIILLVSLTD